MSTTARPARIALQRGPFRVVWHGGEYAEVYAPGFDYAIEVVNMTRPDGTIPAMSRDTLRGAIDDQDVTVWHDTARELRRFPVAGAR